MPNGSIASNLADIGYGTGRWAGAPPASVTTAAPNGAPAPRGEGGAAPFVDPASIGQFRSTAQRNAQGDLIYTEEAAADITRRQTDIFNRVYRPSIVDTIGTLKDTSIIEDALGRESRSVGRSKEQRAREFRRYGVAPTAIQNQEMDAALLAENATSRANEINLARERQRDRNENLRTDLINIGRGIETASAAALSGAADNHVARLNQREQQNAAESAQITSGVASLGATALLAAAFL